MVLQAKGHATGFQRGVVSYASRFEEEELERLGNLEQRYLSNAGRVFSFDLELDHNDDQGKEIKHSVHGEVSSRRRRRRRRSLACSPLIAPCPL